MLTDSISNTPQHARSRRDHDDSPDTRAAFAHLARLDAGPERDLLCEQVVEAWLPMAHRIASRFRDKGESMEDLKQVAAIGLLKAVNRYDPGRGAFESYAVPTITGELRRHFRDHTWDLHVPRSVQELRNKVRAARRELMQQPGSPEPTLVDLAAKTGLSESQVRDGLTAIDSYQALSLDAEFSPTDGDGFNMADTLGTPEPSYDLVADREAAKPGLRHLPERERTILYLRFFEHMTQSRIGEELGISQMHVSRLIRESCARVREEAREKAELQAAA
ncbi:SigB/SigF/SigG family RNA polymerase sigma factor [Streptomyces sp. BA2]|uniref:SigB/SigF/SigG family RNA polymerase sigma factor n=1 Tax=Streptomyces sp. BA2 TaxID=436595 RepID=UPI0013287545|nr:SigB/SigF/SigG family RNA polymerase sigma factor [Streptomyces sp. BA2]MWA08318.1 SigB/SigF/SigG family RNA polymerase sigma factor [Streptomyces sp. BA2]